MPELKTRGIHIWAAIKHVPANTCKQTNAVRVSNKIEQKNKTECEELIRWHLKCDCEWNVISIRNQIEKIQGTTKKNDSFETSVYRHKEEYENKQKNEQKRDCLNFFYTKLQNAKRIFYLLCSERMHLWLLRARICIHADKMAFDLVQCDNETKLKKCLYAKICLVSMWNRRKNFFLKMCWMCTWICV